MNFLSDITVIMPTMRRDHAQNVIDTLGHRPLILAVNSERIETDIPPHLKGARVVTVDDCHGIAKAVEAALDAVQTRLYMHIADDVVFVGENDAWLIEALRVYNEKLGDGDGVVALNDGVLAPNIAAYPLMSKAFYMKNCYPSPYWSWYMDCEWTVRARAQGVYHYAENARIKHLALPTRNDPDDRDGKLFYQRNPR